MKPRVPQKRKYNAAYRLRQKIGEADFPKRSKIIHSEPETVEKHPEAKILLKNMASSLNHNFFKNTL